MTCAQPAALWSSQFGYLLSALALAAIGCGGQSGNEGELPAAPCPRGETVAVGRIEMVADGCVKVRIERVLTKREADSQALSPSELDPGATVAGRLGNVYAWRHDFKQGDPVAVFVPTGSDYFSLELFPLDDDRAQVQWGLRQMLVELGVFTAPDCDEQLWSQRESAAELESNLSKTTPTSPAVEPVSCTP